ncbi:hypothetical protein L9F63_005040, partial [Diploptera punctata]
VEVKSALVTMSKTLSTHLRGLLRLDSTYSHSMGLQMTHMCLIGNQKHFTWILRSARLGVTDFRILFFTENWSSHILISSTYYYFNMTHFNYTI